MRVALTTGMVLLLSLTLGGGIAGAVLPPNPVAAQAKPCQAETKRLNAFKRKMATRRRAFFRSHRSRKQRRSFVKKQNRKLKALKRTRARCLRRSAPSPAPAPLPPAPLPPAPPVQPPATAPPPAGAPPDTTRPELTIDSPAAGAWFAQPSATVRGTARDAGSGVTGVTCNGKAAALAGESFSCSVPLAVGSNTLAVTATDGVGNTRVAGVSVRHGPGLLAGDAGANAAGAVGAVDTDLRHDEAQVSVTPEGMRVARGEIGLRIAAAATVEQVNAALQSVGGRIVAAVEDLPQLAVGIPDPGSLAALEALLAQLRTQPGVARAELADMPATNMLPPGFASPLPSAGAQSLSHLLAMRMPAAWNARAAIRLGDRPTLIVADKFGNGPLSSHVEATYNSADMVSRAVRSEHGYHVAGIAASRFATDGTTAGNVTGVFSSPMSMHLIDATGASAQVTGIKIINAAKSMTGHVVVNTSLGYETPASDTQAQEDGSDWAQLVRGTPNLEARLLHATSAGNSAGPAATNSRWAAAAVRSDLENRFGQPTAALGNTLAVENLVDTGSPDFEPGCLGINSNRAGTIAAVGTDVFSHRFGSAAGDKTGTSMASPQVAGLGMFLWSIDPSRTGAELRDLMVKTARTPLPNTIAGGCGTDVPSSPRLDAYTAVLALDQPVAVTPATARVRLAILSQDSDADFDDDDLEEFAPAARPDAGDRDWSRSDLNGDGFTGGVATAPLDLDPTASPRNGPPKLDEEVEAEIEGIDVKFDERAVTDLQALCFYAYSGLYTGSVDRRADLLDPADNCGAEADFDNGKLVVSGKSPWVPGNVTLRLWLIEPPADPVAFTPEGELPGKAEFRRDGTRIAYSRFSSSTPGIWTIGPAGETPAHVAGTVEGDEHPTWSPDGSRIAFARAQGANSGGIFIVDSDGGVPVLIPGTAGFGEPSWSPDGRRIAATTQRFWGDEIATFAPDGTDLRELTNDVHADLDPDWSPDSDELVFASDRPVPGFTVVRERLYLMDADGSNVRLFTTPFGSNTSGTTVEDHHPSWSPDGRSIAFARSHQNSDRFVMTKELTADAAVPVTPLPDSEESHTFDFPDWQPIPRP